MHNNGRKDDEIKTKLEHIKIRHKNIKNISKNMFVRRMNLNSTHLETSILLPYQPRRTPRSVIVVFSPIA